MGRSSPRKLLQKKYDLFNNDALVGESLWSIFSQVVAGNNYVTAIAKKMKKNKSLISRQIRKLADYGVVTVSGTGVKQFYQPDWETFTTYWIWEMELFYSVIDAVPDLFSTSKFTPSWASALSLKADEDKEAKDEVDVSSILEPVIPQTAQIVKLAVEPLCGREDVTTFFDAFFEVSKAFAFSVAELAQEIDPDEIDIEHSRKFVEALFHPRVRAWLKIQALADMVSANVVRNYLLKLAGLIKG